MSWLVCRETTLTAAVLSSGRPAESSQQKQKMQRHGCKTSSMNTWISSCVTTLRPTRGQSRYRPYRRKKNNPPLSASAALLQPFDPLQHRRMTVLKKNHGGMRCQIRQIINTELLKRPGKIAAAAAGFRGKMVSLELMFS